MKQGIVIGLLVAGVLLAIGGMGKLGWDNYQLKKRYTLIVQQLNEKLQEADLDLGRAKTELGNTEAYVSELEERLQEEIKTRQAVITRYAKLEVAYNVLVDKQPATTEIPASEPIKVDCPELKLAAGLLYQALSPVELRLVSNLQSEFQDHRIKIGCLIAPEEGKLNIPTVVSYQLTLKIRGTLIETITPTGAINHYIRLWEIDNDNKTVGELALKEFHVIVNDKRKSQFYWWAPHIDVSAIGGINTKLQLKAAGSVGISLMGYGLTRNDLIWRFAKLSWDIYDTVGLGIEPVSYNLGAILPLISNLWIGPHFTIGADSSKLFGLALGAVL